jgi:4-amino-4-deoxy-L-arabinose transferase
VLLLGALLLLPGLGAAPFERAEIYFLDAARGMVESGDWLVPRYRGQPFFDKPALAYWLMAASMAVGGTTAAAGRLVSALAALGVLGATLWLGTMRVGARAAACGAVVLATTLGFVSFGRLAMSDMLMTLWCTLAVATGVRLFAGPAGRVEAAALGAVLGLGFLTKGPVALLLPGLALLLLALEARRDGRAWPSPSRIALAAGVFAPIAFGWFVLIARRLGPEPLRWFFLSENLERFAGATYDTGRPVWYYAGAYLALGLPWSPLLPLALHRAWRERDRALRFLLGWAALMAVPLSLSRGKLDYYLLPLLPPLSLAVGHFLAAASWRTAERVVVRAWLVAVGAGLLLLAAGPAAVPAAWLPSSTVLAMSATAAVAAALLCAWTAVRLRPLRALGALAAVAGGLILALGALYVPAFAAAQPQQALLAEVRQELAYRPDVSLVMCGDPARVQRAVLFEARRAGQERCDLWAAVAEAPALFVLDADAQLSVGQTLRPISRHAYLPADTLTLQGLASPARPGWLYLAANFDTESPLALRREAQAHKRAVRARRAARESGKEPEREDRETP